jgi:hypothetical protein
VLATLLATGFSQNTGRPARASATSSSACVGVGVAMTAASKPTPRTSSLCYGADPVGDQCGPGSVAIGDDLVDLRQVNEGGGVERADASSTDHADPHDAPPSRHAAT